MITSSNFFRKTFFTIEPPLNNHSIQDNQEGPWKEEAVNFASINIPKSTHRRFSSRYQYHQSNKKPNFSSQKETLFKRRNKKDKTTIYSIRNTKIQKLEQIQSKQKYLNFIINNNKHSGRDNETIFKQERKQVNQFNQNSNLKTTKYRMKQLERLINKSKKQKNLKIKDERQDLCFIKKQFKLPESYFSQEKYTFNNGKRYTRKSKFLQSLNNSLSNRYKY